MGPFHQAFFKSQTETAKFGSSRLQRQSWDRTTQGKPCRHSRVSRMHRERGTRTVRKFSRVSWRWNKSRYDGCLSHHSEPLGENIEEKAGSHIDDFLVTRPEPKVERFLEQAGDKLNMQDAVRLYKTGDESKLLAMNIRKLEKWYTLKGCPLPMQGISIALGMENANAKASLIAESINDQRQSTRRRR